MKKTQEENNRMIAEFMNCVIVGEFVKRIDNENSNLISELRYHDSWDWLMPVVGKIEALGYSVLIHNNTVYQAVVQFIEWYNQQLTSNQQ